MTVQNQKNVKSIKVNDAVLAPPEHYYWNNRQRNDAVVANHYAGKENQEKSYESVIARVVAVSEDGRAIVQLPYNGWTMEDQILSDKYRVVMEDFPGQWPKVGWFLPIYRNVFEWILGFQRLQFHPNQ